MASGQDEIYIPDDINQRIEWALGDVTAAVQDFSTAYNISVSIVENVETYKADMESLGDSGVSTSCENLPTIASQLKTLNETDFNTLGGLGTMYSMYSDVVLTMLEMVDDLESGTREKVLEELKNGKSIDDLFADPPDALANIIAKKGFTAGTKKGVQKLFSQILKDHNKEFMGDYGGAMLGTATGFTLDWFFNGSISKEDLMKLGVNISKDTLSAVTNVNDHNINPFMRRLAENMSKHSVGVANAVTGFVLSFGANVAIAAITEGKDFGWDDVGDSAIKAGIGVASNVASKALVGALCKALCVSAEGGPAAVAIAVAGTVLTYAGTKLYEKIKHWLSTNGDGIPKKYEHMTNEELLKIMHENGYSFGPPTYEGCTVSAFDMANTLSRYGASEELITFIEAGAGANVPIDCLYQDAENGVVDAKTQAIIDYFFNPNFVSDTRTDESFRESSAYPDDIEDGYADEYNEQIRELQMIFAFGGLADQDPNLRALENYCCKEFAYYRFGKKGAVAENIEAARTAQYGESE